MARNDGRNRVSVRNANLTNAQIINTQRHNEREKESYVNPDIVPEATVRNVHFKAPDGSYAEMFARLEDAQLISTRGLKADAKRFGELIFDVNSAYFDNHGGYEFAKQFYADAYQAAAKIAGGEQYVLSAVMHADERNRAMSEALGRDVYHYHLHVVYIPVVEKQILWTKRCRDPVLVGTVKETIMQVSSSKKWQSRQALDDTGQPMCTKNGKPVLKKSYSILQDDFYSHMKNVGYTDIERGERGSSEEHLTVTEFKVVQEQARLSELWRKKDQALGEIDLLQREHAETLKSKELAAVQMKKLAPIMKNMEDFAQKYARNPAEVLPEPTRLESGKAYRSRILPLFGRIISVLKAVYRKYQELKSDYARLQDDCLRARNASEHLLGRVHSIEAENTQLRGIAGAFRHVCNYYGEEHVARIVESKRIREAQETNAHKKKHREEELQQ